MRTLPLILVLLIASLVGGCSKSSSGPTTAEGKWKYTTSDGKIAITFDLVKTSSGSLDLQNQTFKLSGTTYNSAAQMTGVALPVIASVRINANDATLTYPYYIQFTNGKVSGDFNRIEVPDGDYTFPGGMNTLKNVSIVRQ